MELSLSERFSAAACIVEYFSRAVCAESWGLARLFVSDDYGDIFAVIIMLTGLRRNIECVYVWMAYTVLCSFFIQHLGMYIHSDLIWGVGPLSSELSDS